MCFPLYIYTTYDKKIKMKLLHIHSKLLFAQQVNTAI